MKKNSLLVTALIFGVGLGVGCALVAVFVFPKEDPAVETADQKPDPAPVTPDVDAPPDASSDAPPDAAQELAVTQGAPAGYVADAACAECHQEIYASYQHVGMANSFTRPHPDKSIEDFDNSKFYHEPSQRYYEMIRREDGLFFSRYQLDPAGERINEFQRRVDWILGSGNHSRQYLYQTDAGEIYEFPIAWYSQEGKWAMAPRFDLRLHEGVGRQVERDCLFCHNAYPDVPAGSDLLPTATAFPLQMPEGIGCQRCHGPGEQHVLVTATDPDAAEQYRATVVNPANLDPQLRDDVCQQCHLQPSALTAGVRRFGRGDYSFRPGQPLAEYLVAIDIAEKDRAPQDRFEINHHAYRLRRSKCFVASEGELHCTTCHDPHRKVEVEQRAAHYRAACQQCHQEDACTVDPATDHHQGLVDGGDCVSCHMPQRRPQDVVHVTMTDHLIRKALADEEPPEPLAEAPPMLTNAFVAPLPGMPEGDEAELYRSIALLRLSRYTHVDAATQLENALAAADESDVGPYWDLIKAQLRQQRFAAAKNTTSLVLRQVPKHPLAIEWQGVALMSLQKFELAEKQFRQALQLDGSRAETHFNLGLVLLDTERPREAANEFRQTLALRPNMAKACYYLAIAYSELGQPAEAVRTLRRALEIEPADARTYLDLGEQLAKLERRDEVERYWRHGIQVAANPRPLIEAFQQADFAAVKPVLSQATDGPMLDPVRDTLVAVPLPDLAPLEASVGKQIQEFVDSFQLVASQAADSSDIALAEAYATLGQLYHAYELNEAAECCYVNAIRLAPRDSRPYHLIATLYQQAGRLALAETFFKMVIKLSPDNVPATVRLGMIQMETNRLADARASFQRALELDETCAAAVNGLGDVALAEKKFTEAIPLFEEALKRVPAANKIHYSLAMAYRGLGDLEQAKSHLEKRGPVGLRPADPLIDSLPELIRGERIYLIRGRMAFGAGRFAEAAAAFAEAVNAKPDSVRARINFGTALVQLNRTEEAIEQYRKVIELEPENVTVHYNLGALTAQQGDHAEAVEHLRAVLQSTPDDRAARRLLAGSLQELGQTDQALTQLEQVVAEAPDDEPSLIDLTNLLVELRQYKRAIDLLDTAQTRSPDRVPTAHALARLLATCPDADLRNGPRAVELAKRVVEAKKTIEYGETLALALAQADRCEEAASLQKQLVAEAEKANDSELVTRLKRDLERYAKGSPCRPVAEAASLEPVPDSAAAKPHSDEEEEREVPEPDDVEGIEN